MVTKKTNYIVKDLIPERMITLLTGKPGSYKSWIMASLAINAANGESLFEAYPSERCDKIIYIDEDTPQSLYEQRLDDLALGAIPEAICQKPMTNFRLVDDPVREALCQEIKGLSAQGKKVLVLLDCLAKVADGLNIDRTDGAVKAMKHLSEIRETGATVVVTHHISIHRKGRQSMNNTQIKAGCDSIIQVEGLSIENKHFFSVYPEAKRVLLTTPFAVKLEGDSGYWAYMQKTDQFPVIPTDDEKLLFRLFPDTQTEWTVRDISESTGRDLPDNRIRDALDQLVKQGCLERVIDPHDRSHAAYYKLHSGFTQSGSIYKQYIK